MLPLIIRASAETLRLVPDVLREASAALGATRSRVVMSVVLPTARSGLITAAASVTLLASGQIPAAVAYSLLGGISLGAISALQGIYTQELVPPQDLGLLFGAQQAAFGAGGALGPAAAAVLLAVTSSYTPVSAAIAAAFLASAIMLIRQPEMSAPAAPSRSRSR